MKRGFTLIELLAVIVILGVIALIITPAIIRTVNEAKSSALLRSAEFYYNAIEDGLTSYSLLNKTISDGTYYIMSNGNICLGKIDNDVCNSDIIVLELEKSSKIPSSGFFVYKNEVIEEMLFEMDGKLISKNKRGQIIYDPIGEPELANKTLIPVIYDGKNWVVADANSDWYDYRTLNWANAVILRSGVNKKVGDKVTVDGTNSEALAMFVWIPRYEYKINGKYGTHLDGTAGDYMQPGEIEVNFIPSTQDEADEGYMIHPAFTLGDKELSGIWVGKFETSHETLHSSRTVDNLNCNNEECKNADGLRILPNNIALRYNSVSNFFYAARSMSRSGNAFRIDSDDFNTHMMKNSEWGAVAYLSHSIYGKYGNDNYTGENKEVYKNNSNKCYTGRSGGVPTGVESAEGTYLYNEGILKENIYEVKNSLQYPWSSNSGSYSSTNHGPNSTSDLVFEFELETTETISFDWAVSGEKCCDYMYYTIKKDGQTLAGTGTSTKIANASTEITYQNVSKQLEPGNYQVIFTYRKDTSVNTGLDTGYVKNFSITKTQLSFGSGIGASTTGNITGVYDMSGGAWEYVMGNYSNTIVSSGFKNLPEKMYYDLYTTKKESTACNGGICYGHGLSETSNWYGDYPYFLELGEWVERGGWYGGVAGTFYSTAGVGYGTEYISFRIVMTP